MNLGKHSLLKLKKYEELVYNEDNAIVAINEITDLTSHMKVSNEPKNSDKDQQNKNSKNYTFSGNCWKCGEFSLSAKECQNNSTMATQDQNY